MNDALKNKWDQRYAKAETPGQPSDILLQNNHLLPAEGVALDLACGLGANALLMAEHGLDTHAWDLSNVAVEKLQGFAAERGLSVKAQTKDIQAEPPQAASLDVLVIAHFLERDMRDVLIEALRPGGMLFYQTFIQDKVDSGGPSSPDFLLATGELLQQWGSSPMRPLVYREEGCFGDTSRGWRNRAMLVAVKDAS